MDMDACLPPTAALIVGRRASVLLGVPVDWATAIALNPSVAGTICARNNNVHQLLRCVPCVNEELLNAWLEMATNQGHKDVVQFLCELPLDRGVDPAADSNHALVLAALHGHRNVVQYLCELPLDRGIDPAVGHNWALRWAAENGHFDVVKYLCELPLDRGVDPAADNNGAMRWAERNGHLNLVQYLCMRLLRPQNHEDDDMLYAGDDQYSVRPGATVEMQRRTTAPSRTTSDQ